MALTTLFLLVLQTSATPSDLQRVQDAVQDYLHGFYDAEPARLERTLHESLDKIGLARRSSEDPYSVRTMSFEQAKKLAVSWNGDGNRVDPKTAIAEIEVLGIYPEIATAKLTAVWGIDYFQLLRDGDRWRIHHVLWQTHPGEPGAAYQASDEDRTAMMQAGFDYVDSFYKRKEELLDRSVDKELRKLGRYRPTSSEEFQAAPTNFENLRKLVPRIFADGVPANAIREVRILDQLDRTGVLEIHGQWGIDYVNVMKVEDDWKIRQVIWQSHPTPDEMADVFQMADCVNKGCPFSGKPVSADSLTLFMGQVVGFCNSGCRDRFAKSPSSFPEAAEGLKRIVMSHEN